MGSVGDSEQPGAPERLELLLDGAWTDISDWVVQASGQRDGI